MYILGTKDGWWYLQLPLLPLEQVDDEPDESQEARSSDDEDEAYRVACRFLHTQESFRILMHQYGICDCAS
jgi:hypothetical protein